MIVCQSGHCFKDEYGSLRSMYQEKYVLGADETMHMVGKARF